MTAFGSMETAVAAMRAGAYDFVTKPIELDLLALTLQRAIAPPHAAGTGQDAQPGSREPEAIRRDPGDESVPCRSCSTSCRGSPMPRPRC